MSDYYDDYSNMHKLPPCPLCMESESGFCARHSAACEHQWTVLTSNPPQPGPCFKCGATQAKPDPVDAAAEEYAEQQGFPRKYDDVATARGHTQYDTLMRYEIRDYVAEVWTDGVRYAHENPSEAVASIISALEFYANPRSWQYTTYDHCGQISNDDYGFAHNKEWEYGGDLARKTLAKFRGQEGK